MKWLLIAAPAILGIAGVIDGQLALALVALAFIAVLIWDFFLEQPALVAALAAIAAVLLVLGWAMGGHFHMVP